MHIKGSLLREGVKAQMINYPTSSKILRTMPAYAKCSQHASYYYNIKCFPNSSVDYQKKIWLGALTSFPNDTANALYF